MKVLIFWLPLGYKNLQDSPWNYKVSVVYSPPSETTKRKETSED